MRRTPSRGLLVAVLVGLLLGTLPGHASPLVRVWEGPSRWAIPAVFKLPLDPALRVERISVADAADIYEKEYANYPDDEVREYADALAAFGFLPAGLDLKKLLLERSKALAVGFYHAGSRRMYVVEGWTPSHVLGVAQEPISVAHELVHAAQDQAMGFSAQRKRFGWNEDLDNAFSFSLEGQALIMGFRIGTPMMPPPVLGPAGLLFAEPMVLMAINPFYGQLSALQGRVLTGGAIPPYLNDVGARRYTEGGAFAWGVERALGPDAHVWLACHPPRSTEHVMHLEKYLSQGDPPLQVLVGEEPGKLDVSMGEWGLKWLLARHGSWMGAADAAAGWGGDTIARQADGSFVWRIVMDGESDAQELEPALAEALRGAGMSAHIRRRAREVQAWSRPSPPSDEEVEQLHARGVRLMDPFPPPPPGSVCWEHEGAQ